MNLLSVFRVLAWVIAFVGSFMLIPLFIALACGEMVPFMSFLISLLLVAVFVTCTLLLTRKQKGLAIGAKESLLIVTLSWIVMTAFGALPLYFTSTMPTYTQCYYEIMSGFTTTGATAIDNVEILPRSVVFWRSLTNWLGGLGVIVIFVGILPLFGVKGFALVGAESTGPTKSKLTPTIQRSSLVLLGIYAGLSLMEIIFLRIGGLSIFDCVCVTCGTMANAGYTVKNSSIAGYNSPYVEWVCIVFMFIAGTNFALYYYPLRGKPGKMLENGELRYYTGITLVLGFLATVNIFLKGMFSPLTALRHGFFQVISFLTTTGFTSTNYSVWPVFAQMLLLLTTFIGGCAGSAAGGIKVSRVVILWKACKNSLKQRVHPNVVTTVKLGDEVFDSNTVVTVGGFVCLYLMNMLIGAVLLSLSGQEFVVCFSAAIQAIGNIGIAFGGLGTNFTFSVFPEWCFWVMTWLMFVGRLELFTVYAVLTPTFWRR